MPELIFSDKLPGGCQYRFRPALFNRLDYINRLVPRPVKSYYIVEEGSNEIFGQLHFSIQGNSAKSLSQALFGSLEADPILPKEVIDSFIKHVNDELEIDGIEQVSVVHPAPFYNVGVDDMITEIYTENGYQQTIAYKNHHIEIGDQSLEHKMHTMEQRKLRKCVQNGLRFEQLPVTQMAEIYEFIVGARQDKTIPVSVTAERLKQSFEYFPEHYHLFGVYDGDTICAATVAVIPVEHVLYNFLPASDVKYNQLSPAVMLYDGLYSYCREHGIQYLDLGISTLPDGTDQEQLIAFKENLGAIATTKPLFERTFDGSVF